jgi:hypothetical protein
MRILMMRRKKRIKFLNSTSQRGLTFWTSLNHTSRKITRESWRVKAKITSKEAILTTMSRKLLPTIYLRPFSMKRSQYP